MSYILIGTDAGVNTVDTGLDNHYLEVVKKHLKSRAVNTLVCNAGKLRSCVDGIILLVDINSGTSDKQINYIASMAYGLGKVYGSVILAKIENHNIVPFNEDEAQKVMLELAEFKVILQSLVNKMKETINQEIG